MNTLVRNEDTRRYYLTDELTANALHSGDRDEPFYAYPSNKDGERLSPDMVEVKPDGEWWMKYEEEDLCD